MIDRNVNAIGFQRSLLTCSNLSLMLSRTIAVIGTLLSRAILCRVSRGTT